jgi:hypothetical protein
MDKLLDQNDIGTSLHLSPIRVRNFDTNLFSPAPAAKSSTKVAIEPGFSAWWTPFDWILADLV